MLRRGLLLHRKHLRAAGSCPPVWIDCHRCVWRHEPAADEERSSAAASPGRPCAHLGQGGSPSCMPLVNGCVMRRPYTWELRVQGNISPTARRGAEKVISNIPIWAASAGGILRSISACTCSSDAPACRTLPGMPPSCSGSVSQKGRHAESSCCMRMPSIHLWCCDSAAGMRTALGWACWWRGCRWTVEPCPGRPPCSVASG